MDRAKYLKRHSKYNTSAKGQARNRKYEAAHPERAVRWEPARDILHRGGEMNEEGRQEVPSS